MAQNDRAGEQRVSPTSVQKALKGMHYPASKQDLVRQAESNGASGEVLDHVRQLPSNQFDSPADVMKAFGKTE